MALPAQTGVQISLDADTSMLRGEELDFIFNGPFLPNHETPHVAGSFVGIQSVRWLHLVDDWWVLRLRGSIYFAPAFEIRSPADTILADVQMGRAGVFRSLATRWPTQATSSKPMPPVFTCWRHWPLAAQK